MASEIRVNKINSQTGVGTITLSPTGVDISGITTVSTLKVGTGVTASEDGDIFFTGVCTATTFAGAHSGSGANLTSLPAANLTGTLPAISAANLTNVPAANITGTLPAISAANLTNIPAANVTGTLPACKPNKLTSRKLNWFVTSNQWCKFNWNNCTYIWKLCCFNGYKI